MANPDKVIVLFLVYGDKYLQDGLNELRKIVSRMFPSVGADYIVVDNAMHLSFDERRSDYRIVGGDNSLWEFSGWDRGFAYAKDNDYITDGSVVFFANDTFYRRQYKDGTNFLDVFDAAILDGRDVRNSAIGYLDDFPKPVSIRGIEYISWIRSNIFAIPSNIVDMLWPFAKTIEPAYVFSDSYIKFWSDNDVISRNWKAYISSWLFGAECPEFPEYKLHWIKAEPVTEENFEYFKKKALCILSEHYLSARLHNMGVPVIDTNIFPKNPRRHIDEYYL